MLKIGDYKPALLHKALIEVTDLVIKEKVKPHVGGVFNVNEIDKAHELLENRNSIGKIIVKW
jgi:NADPH2:quinone reductase